jgi:hypothetical protein
MLQCRQWLQWFSVCAVCCNSSRSRAYLADQGKQGKAPLYAALVNFPEARWLGKYPGYTAWAAGRKQKA